MGYDIKSVFYLDTSTDMSNALGTVANSVSGVSLDISAYIDPVATGRATGVGLAIYRAHFAYSFSDGNCPIDNDETASGRMAVTVGDEGLTSTYSVIGSPNQNILSPENQNLIAAKDFFAPKYTSYGAVGTSDILFPSDDVPYVAVRDTLNLMWGQGDTAMAGVTNMAVRLECAQIKLTGAVLNQLLRTQTV